MSRVILVGAQQHWGAPRRNLILAAFDKVLPGNKCLEFQSAGDAVGAFSQKPGPSLAYVFLGEAESRAVVFEQLLSVVPRIPVIVEIEDDDPRRALDLMRDGTFSVTTNMPPSNFGTLVDVFRSALSGAARQSWPPLAEPWKPTEQGGFMSMNWNFNNRDGADYQRAIRPAMLQLGLKVQRVDEFLQTEGNILLRIKEAITQRRVVVAMISPHDMTQPTSPPSPNVMFEVGLAYALGKRILLLYRDTARDSLIRNIVIPAVLKGELFVEYSSYTDLALKLFFGFGGKAEEIKDWSEFESRW